MRGRAAGAGWITGAGWVAEAGRATKASWITEVGWVTGVGCSMRGACECEVWALIGNALGSRWEWSDMVQVVALVAWALDSTAWAIMVEPWTSPWVIAMVATSVVAMVEPYGGGAAPPKITFSLVNRRGPIS
ncbi:hypothetical protein ACFX2A_018788 [Malus domestica]